jgi:hypothetical protein
MFAVGFLSSVCWFQQCNTPFSRNKSIDFVWQFHWFCLTIPLDLFRQSVAFASPFQLFYRLSLAVLSENCDSIAFLSHQEQA